MYTLTSLNVCVALTLSHTITVTADTRALQDNCKTLAQHQEPVKGVTNQFVSDIETDIETNQESHLRVD